jgi:dUTP pyrophosphatase
MIIKFKRLHPEAKIPTQSHPADAGYDLYCLEKFILSPGDTKTIKCGFAMEIPEGFHGEIRSRSGLAGKCSIAVLNAPGTVDSHYRGEAMIILHNHHAILAKTFEKHERIAQLVITKNETVKFEEVEELSETERGTGGFGSTGAK